MCVNNEHQCAAISDTEKAINTIQEKVGSFIFGTYQHGVFWCCIADITLFACDA